MQASSGSRKREASGRSRPVRTCSWLLVGLLACALAFGPGGVRRAGWSGFPVQAAAASPGLSLSPASGVAYEGTTLAVDIIADCGAHADAVAVTLTFDPTRLQVAAITPDTSQFPNTLLAAAYDNVAGWVRYEAGALTCHSAGSCPSGSVHLANIRFSTTGQCGYSAPLTLTGQLTWQGTYVFNGTGTGSTFVIAIAGDVNGDGQVNVQDCQLVAAHWSSVQGDALYDVRYDLDADGDVDVVDIMLVAARWNQHCSS